MAIAIVLLLPSCHPLHHHHLTAIRIVLPLLLSPIVTPAIAHHRHRCSSPPPSPIAIALPSRHPLRICCRRPSQLCCYPARCPSTCRLVVTLDWLSLCHLNADGVMVSHLFLVMHISITALSVAAAVFLGAIVP
jgi:hypothetical protein